MSDSLDSLLTAADPAASYDDRLDPLLRDLAADAESSARRRRPVRLVLAGGVVAGLLGIGSVAAASGILPGWGSVATSSGQTCEVRVEATLPTPGDGEPITATFSADEQAAALAAAQAFLADLDYASIDHERAIARWQAVEASARASQAPDERQPRLTGDDLEVHAVTWTVVERMRTALADQGLDLRALMVASTTTGCDL